MLYVHMLGVYYGVGVKNVLVCIMTTWKTVNHFGLVGCMPVMRRMVVLMTVNGFEGSAIE